MERPPSTATLGGTIDYMAPEHLKALGEPSVDMRVDGRADIYGLGVVLYEARHRPAPFSAAAPRLVGRSRPCCERSTSGCARCPQSAIATPKSPRARSRDQALPRARCRSTAIRRPR